MECKTIVAKIAADSLESVSYTHLTAEEAVDVIDKFYQKYDLKPNL